MEETTLYNSRITKSYIEYISRHLPDLNTQTLLDDSGISSIQLEDEGYWLTQTQVDRFHEILVKSSGDPNIARKTGRFAPFTKAAGNVSQYILGFVTPTAAYRALSKYYLHLSKGSSLETREVGYNKVEVIATQNPGVKEKPYQCQNRLGMFEGVAKLFTNELAEIEHTTCMHISGNCCVYRISWKSPPSFIWKRISNYTCLLSAIICPFLFFTLQSRHSILVILSVILAVMGVFLYQFHLEKENFLQF